MNSEKPRYATLRDYLRVVRDQRVLIVVITVVFAGVALFVSSRQPAVYEASARLSIQDEAQDLNLTGTNLLPLSGPDGRAATAAALATSQDVADRVKRRLRTNLTARQLKGLVSAEAEARTLFVRISARTPKAETSVTLANVFAQEVKSAAARDLRDKYAAAVRAIEREVIKPANRTRKELGRLKSTQAIAVAGASERISRLKAASAFANPVDIAEPATTNNSPVSPKPVRDTLLGFLLGLVVALLAAFVRDSLDRRLKAASDIRAEFHLPIVGHVRNELMGRTAVRSNGRPALTDPEFETFRIMRTNLDFLDVDVSLKTVVVTSPLPEEGKSTVSSSLALSYATAGQRALLVECDLRRPTMATRLGLDEGPGLSDYLAGNAEPAAILQTVEVETGTSEESDGPKLVCITAGSPSVRPAEALGSERFKAFLAQVRDAYDVVILDTAPLLSVVDTMELLPIVDGLIVCVRASQTTRDQARAARTILEHFPAKPTGIVVTGMKPGSDGEYGYYSYAYSYGS